MSDQSLPLGISEEDWTATPVAVRVVVMELLQRVARLEARLNQKRAEPFQAAVF